MVPPTHLRLMCHVHRQNGVQQLVHSAPTIEKCWSYIYVAVTLKTKCISTTPENSLATGGCFKCNTFHVTVLGWLKKERMEERKLNNSDFRPFQICHGFKIVTIHNAITTADWGRLYKLLYVVLDTSICSPAMISP